MHVKADMDLLCPHMPEDRFCMVRPNWMLVHVCAFHRIFLYNLQADFLY